jgi:hypothetical protein
VERTSARGNIENLGFDHILPLVLGQKHEAVAGSDVFIHRLRRKKVDGRPNAQGNGMAGKSLYY